MDRALMTTANELFEARHYPGVVALVSDALERQPDCVPLLLVRARAHIALRRELEAQADLRDIIRLDPQCSSAYRLLGELAARRDENESASIFFREALRLDPGDDEAQTWLAIVECTARPAAVANKLPAPAAAAGRFPPARGPIARARTANDGQPRSVTSPARSARPGSQPRFAAGTVPPDDDRATAQRWAVSEADADELPPAPRMAVGSSPQLRRYQDPSPPDAEHTTQQGAQPLQCPLARRGMTHELPGFGDYLVSTGILTRDRLRAAQAYQRSMRVQLSTAIVTLGLATPQRIEWAAVAHQAHVGRGGSL